MSGKIILITGSTGGIGKATAAELAKLGGYVIITGRDRSRGEAALAEIRRESGNDSAQLMLADLSSQKGVRELADSFIARHKRLDVLINNVGGLYGNRYETVDGIEATLALNHLCPFLLTLLLLPALRAGAPSRIVNVSSIGHKNVQRINFDDLQNIEYRGFLVYSQTKLANLLFTYELADRLNGERITVNALHPGIVQTDIGKTFCTERFFPDRKYVSCVFCFLAETLIRLFFKFDDLEKAAQACIYVAASSELDGVTGKYFDNNEQMVQSSLASYDKAAALRLWQVSSELTGCGEAAVAAEGRDPSPP
jgi:NAD(P)-dependent dehydrogenase (short-subunit alcohol dehydrogenase family)